MVLALPDQHRLGQRRKVRPGDLEGESFVSLTRAAVGRHLIDRVFDEAGVQRRLAVEAQFSAAVAALVAAGQGVGLIDPFTAAEFAAKGHTWIAFEPEIEFHVGILYPTHRALSRTAREFIGMLKAAGQALLRKRGSL
jgi:DNA-binding transcriptional LysR family regulator